MKHLLSIAVLPLLILPLSSCKLVSDLIHDDEVVAKVGKTNLYRSQLESFVPGGLSPEDSTEMARQYIDAWAGDLLFMELAGTQLSKEEMDVTEEIEDYRRSLLKYRYEQRYINERLDTLVTPSQIEEYYDSHKDMFELSVPVVKARFLDIMKESPYVETLKDKMSSDKYEDLVAADSLAYSSALNYRDNSDRWVDIVTFAKDFGTDYATLLSKMDKNGFVEIPDERGDLKIGYICDIRRSGMAPVEYCEDRIRDIIISSRKRTITSTLERDLLNDALKKEHFVIY